MDNDRRRRTLRVEGSDDPISDISTLSYETPPLFPRHRSLMDARYATPDDNGRDNECLQCVTRPDCA